jgi:cytochrome c oxidase subunit 2
MKRNIIAALLGGMILTAFVGSVVVGNNVAGGVVIVGSPEERVIAIKAKKFEFTPSVINVKKGVPVVLELTSEDRVHGFNLPDFKVRTEVKADGTSRVRFTPDKVGSFTFVCDVYCGSGHEDMSGTIVISE